MRYAPTPSREDMISAYEKLSFYKGRIEYDDLVTYCHWARLDARLAELLIIYFEKTFKKINPFSLNRKARASFEPQNLAVILELGGLRMRAKKSKKTKLYNHWRAIAQNEIGPTSFKMFFISQGRPNPNRDFNEIKHSLQPYLKYGFFGDELVGQPKSLNKQATVLTVSDRKKILDSLTKNQFEITVSDYRKACKFQIHTRMAERDLKAHSKLSAVGETRNRKYVVD